MITVEKELYGKYSEKEIFKYKIKNSDGFQVNILNYAGTVTEIYVKDKNRNLKNVVLGYENFEKYVGNKAYPGMIIGRTSGRIENAEIEIDGVKYSLDKNDGENSLHGGLSGFSSKVFDVDVIDKGVELSCKSSHMEGGYPGNLTVKIRYTVREDNSLTIEYEAETDQKTYVNLTNHSYFNLSGNMDENGDEQILKIKADNICELKEGLIPTGKLLNVKEKKNEIFDFNEGKKIKDGIKKGYEERNCQFNITRAYDHSFELNDALPDDAQITLKSLYSRIKMEIFTTEKTAVIYTGNFLDDVEVFNNSGCNEKNARYSGVAIETQDYPNGVNEKNFNAEILEKDEKYYSRTVFKFSNF